MDAESLDVIAKWVVGAIVFCAGWGCLGYYVAKQCGRNVVEGFVFGFILGPLGVILVALMPRR